MDTKEIKREFDNFFFTQQTEFNPHNIWIWFESKLTEAEKNGIQKAINICMEVYSEAMNDYHDNMKFDDRESNEVIAGCAIIIKSKIEGLK